MVAAAIADAGYEGGAGDPMTDADMRDNLVEMFEAHEANIARAEATLLQ